MTASARATDPSRAVIAREDVEQAQKVVEAWGQEYHLHIGSLPAGAVPYMRGLVTQALADAHALGYEQGVQRGRRQIGNALRDVLETEGC